MTYPENLDELFIRKARRLTAPWAGAYGQDGTTYVYAQPMTLSYTPLTQDGSTTLTTLDNLPGEVWRLSDTPNLATIYHKDIAFSQWSADGRRLALFAYNYSLAPYTGPELSAANNLCYLVCETTGRYLRPPVEGPNRQAGNYFHWSPQVPDAWYDVGSPFLDALGLGLDESTLYQGTVSDTGGSSTALVSGLSKPLGALGKLISADGKRVIVRNYGDAITSETLQPCTVFGSPSKDTSTDIVIDRNFATYGETGYPNRTQHDAYYNGIGDWYFSLPSDPSLGVWWRVRRTGSGGDGGALYTGDSNCCQYLYTNGVATGGAFRLTFNDNVTSVQSGYIAYNAAAFGADTGDGSLGNPHQTVQAALTALSNVGSNNVGCSFGRLGTESGFGWVDCFFCGTLARTDFPLMTVDNASMVGSTVVCVKGRAGHAAAAYTEVIPVNHGGFNPNGLPSGGEICSPFVDSDPGTYTATPNLTTYWSHPGFDRWGRCVAFGMVASGFLVGGVTTFGQAVWDFVNANQITPCIYQAGASCQHSDWNGFSDTIVCSYGPEDDGVTYTNDRLMVATYNDAASQKSICYTYTNYNNNYRYGDYAALARPFLSPDGTKVAFHSTFLNGFNDALYGSTDSAVDIYWCVARYPLSGVGVTAASSGTGGTITVSWLPPSYTSRRWIEPGTGLIDESAGEVLYAREVKNYHLWRTPDLAGSPGAWSEVGSLASAYGNDPTTNTLKPKTGVGGAFVDGSHPIPLDDTLSDGTYHYAVTCEEWSGLESRTLGVGVKVTVAGGVVTGTQALTYNQTDFWTTAPAPPSGFSAASTGTAGLNSLSWTEPGGSKVRHYNVYYSTSEDPSIAQSRRIASLPVGTSAYKDWLADPAASAHYYAVTSVDRQGNESAATARIGGVPRHLALAAGGVRYILNY